MTLKSFFNFILILLLVSVPIALSVWGKMGAASLSLISLSFGLVFWNLEKFSEFSGAGFAAKLRTAVDEAYAAIDEVKSLALSISSPVVSLMAIESSFQYLPLKYKLEYAEKISSSLHELDIEKERIDETLSTIYGRVEQRHIEKILWAMNEKLPQEEKLFQSRGEIVPEDWPLDAVKRKCTELGVDVSEEIKDLEYFKETRKLRNPDAWQG